MRLLMVDGLHPVRVPGTEEEALRDLVRAREDVRGDLMRARHRLSKLLLRHDVTFDGPGVNWGARHREWLSRVALPDRGAHLTLLDYLGAIDALLVRRDTLESSIGELVPGSPWAQTVSQVAVPARDRHALRGRAVRGDRRLGALPASWAADELPRCGPQRELKRTDTPPGSDHEVWVPARPAAARRGGLALPPRASEGPHMRRRQEGQSPHVIALSWKAQQRLHRTWRRLDTDRGKRKTIVAVAVARELAGFCWAIANTD